MRKKILFLVVITAIILYYCAPKGYSLPYSIMCTIAYLLSSLTMLTSNCRYSLVKFELFFLIAIFFTNYVYSLVYYPINPYFSLFGLSFNEDYISKGLGLSTVGVCIFNIGVLDERNLPIIKSQIIDEKIQSPKLITTILMFIFIPSLIVLYQTGLYTTEFEHSIVNTILVYLLFFSIFYTIYTSRRINSFLIFFKKEFSSLFFYVVVVYVLLFLLIGSRTIPLRVILLFFFLCTIYIKPVNSLTLLLLMAVGALGMTYVGVVREGATFEASALTSVFDLGQDLTINNRSLYVLMEYGDTQGFTFGRTMLMNILSVIPYGQSAFLALTGWRISDIASANLVTDLYFDNTNDLDYKGLGTNIIGDIYVAFGFLGVVILMYFLGRVIRYIYSKSKEGNNLAIFIYALIFMDAIYYTRSSYLNSLRAVAWCFVIYSFFKVSQRKKNSKIKDD